LLLVFLFCILLAIRFAFYLLGVTPSHQTRPFRIATCGDDFQVA
jgi:hypothetical protein